MNPDPATAEPQKVRVLFVDDEPLILGMLPRLVGQYRDKWEVISSASGACQPLWLKQLHSIISRLSPINHHSPPSLPSMLQTSFPSRSGRITGESQPPKLT